MKGPLSMVGETLKSMLGRLNRSEDLDRLPAKLAALINTYDNADEIHPQFRMDMMKALESTIELAELMALPEYDATAVQRHAFTVLSLMPTFIRIAENSQLSRVAYAIQNKASRVTLPNIYNTEGEAKEALRVLGSMLDINLVEIIPIKVSLASGAPPKNITAPPMSGASPIPPPFEGQAVKPPPMPSPSGASEDKAAPHTLTTQNPEEKPH
jgi:hypothetical protein